MLLKNKLDKNPGHFYERRITYERFFDLFADAASNLTNDKNPIKGISFEYTKADKVIFINALDVQIKLKLKTAIHGDTLIAYIYAFVLNTETPNKYEYLDKMKFNGQGVTDYVDAQYGDPITLQDYAELICLHFLELALEDQVQ